MTLPEELKQSVAPVTLLVVALTTLLCGSYMAREAARELDAIARTQQDVIIGFQNRDDSRARAWKSVFGARMFSEGEPPRPPLLFSSSTDTRHNAALALSQEIEINSCGHCTAEGGASPLKTR